MTDAPNAIVERRKRRLAEELGRSLQPPTVPSDIPPLTENRRVFLLEEAEELYWNELEWERVTDEERVDGEPLTELIFPGFLAFVRGLLLQEVQEDSLAGAEPRPQVVEEIALFLARRLAELRQDLNGRGEDLDQRRVEEALTSRLLDLTLREYFGVSPEEAEGGMAR